MKAPIQSTNHTLLSALVRILCVFLVLTLVASSAFAQKKSAKASSKSTEWKEMEAFHGVMAKTFHPMEDGDLKPIMARAGEMATKAQQWANSKAPKEFDKPAIKDLLSKLTEESKALADLVASKASEDDIKKSLTALHERFHEISGACRTDEHGNHKHEHKGKAKK
jgi:hypothetical protein